MNSFSGAMHQIEQDRQRRIKELWRDLQDIALAKAELVRQLEHLDVLTAEYTLEHNKLVNLGGPISRVPDEIIAMIFEQGTLMRARKQRKHDTPHQHFGVIASHVTSRWRAIALTTPRLWTKIKCIPEEHGSPYSKELQDRVSAFLSRAGSLSIDITVMQFKKFDLPQDIIELIGNRCVHCRRLRVVDVSPQCLTKVLKCISSQPMPLLNSMHIGSQWCIKLEDQLLQSSPPYLKTVQLDDIDPLTMHLCLPAFHSVTSLRLTNVVIGDHDDGKGYNALRDCLTAMEYLEHLELHVGYFKSIPTPTYLSMVLPTLRLLHVTVTEASPESLSNVICCIQATSLVTLSLKSSDERWAVGPVIREALEPRFSSLQHLILANVASTTGDIAVLAQSFPDIVRLTLESGTRASLHNVNDILEGVLFNAVDGGRYGERWPNLQIIGVSTTERRKFQPARLQDLILKSQQAGHPICKLALPRATFPIKGAHGLAALEELVEISHFHGIDWPTPFDWEG